MSADQVRNVETPLTTAAVAAATGYSVQQVRKLEDLGVIPAAARAANGYRQFDSSHVQALGAYRDLALAVGPVAARQVLRAVRQEPPAETLAVLSGLHAQLLEEREQTLAARRALEAIHAEDQVEAAPVASDVMTITELSQALGVRASTLRFWESAGLVAPHRIQTRSGTARRYDLPAVHEARIAAALRAGGYRIPEVRQALDALRDVGDTHQADAALDARLARIADRMLALLRAGAAVADALRRPETPC